MNTFSAKAPSESITVGIDFTKLLGTGETISSVSYTASLQTGTDPSPSSLISGAASYSGNIALQRVVGGLAGVTYLVSATVVTSLGNTLMSSAFLPVVNGGA